MTREMENALVADLTSQTERYEAARLVARRVFAALQQREDVSAEMARLAALMNDVAGSASAANALREQWAAEGRSLSVGLQAAVESHKRVLLDLISLVQQAEQAAVAARDQLAPRLDSGALDRHVVQRYGDASRL